jgi:hypothetical protein
MNKKTDLLLAIIAMLLVIILAFQAYSVITTNQQRALAEQRVAEYAERVTAAHAVVDSQRDVIFGMLDSYETDVYNNPRADRIAEQQLIAEEYQLTALQVIVVQNSQLIELLAITP